MTIQVSKNNQHNQHIQSDQDRLFDKYIDLHSQEAYELLLEIGRIPAPLHGETKRSAFCRDWLIRKGAKNTYIDEVGNVICPIGNCDEGEPLIVFMAHSDVVFPDTEPLPMEIHDGRIYCPGIGDDTTNVVAMLMATAYFIELDMKPKTGGILVVVDVGEEGLGNLCGCRKIMEDFGDRITEVISFDAWNGVIDDRSIGSKRFRISADTEGGHSLKDFGKPNAIVILADLINNFYAIDLPADARINVGTIKGGTTVNVIAAHAEMLFEYRAEKQESAAYMDHKIKQLLDEKKQQLADTNATINAELVGERPMMGNVDETRMQNLRDRMAHYHEKAFGITPTFKVSSTDCNIPLSMGIPAICVGCFRGGGTHTRDEYIEIDSLKAGYKMAMCVIGDAFN